MQKQTEYRFLYKLSPKALHPALENLENSELGMRIARGVAWSAIGSIASRGLTLVAMVFVARVLGTVGFGELGMFQATVGMVGVFAGFGIGVTATKHVAELHRSDPDRVGRILGLLNLVSVATGGLMALVLLVAAPVIAGQVLNAPHLESVFRIGAIVLFLSVINGTQTGALAGFESFRSIARINFLVGVISFPLIIAGAHLGGVEGIAWVLALNLLLNFLLNRQALTRDSRNFRITISYWGSLSERSILWSYSFPAVISATLVIPVFWLAKSMLANQPGGYSELGVLAVAETWKTFLIFGCSLITQAAFPVLSQLFGEGNGVLYKKALVTQFWINGLVVVSGALVVSLLAGPIMGLYGEDFVDSATVLMIVMLSCIPTQLGSVAGLVNKSIGNIWWGVLLNSIWAVIYLFLFTMLIDQGARGFALAMLLAYCVHLATSSLYIVWVFKRHPKFKRMFN